MNRHILVVLAFLLFATLACKTTDHRQAIQVQSHKAYDKASSAVQSEYKKATDETITWQRQAERDLNEIADAPKTIRRVPRALPNAIFGPLGLMPDDK